jgi:hypothetical protein
MRGEEYCYAHNPKFAAKARADRLRAARTKPRARRPKAPPPASPVALQSPEDIRRVVESTIGSLLRGEIDRGRANSVLYGLQVALRAVDVADFERRLKALEGGQGEGKSGRKGSK